MAKLLLFSGGQRTRKTPSKRHTAGGGGSWALRALAGGGPLPGEAQNASPDQASSGPESPGYAAHEHLPSQSEPDARPAGGELEWAQGRLLAEGGRAREGAAERGEGGQGAAA